MKLYDGGAYLLGGKELIADGKDALAEVKRRSRGSRDEGTGSGTDHCL